MNPTVQQSGSSVRLTYRNRTVVAAHLNNTGLLIVEYSDGVVENTGIELEIAPPVLPLILAYSDGTPLTYSNGVYLEYSA